MSRVPHWWLFGLIVFLLIPLWAGPWWVRLACFAVAGFSAYLLAGGKRS